jgi:hypothetical protein
MLCSIAFDTAVTVFGVFRLLLNSLQTALLAFDKAPLLAAAPFGYHPSLGRTRGSLQRGCEKTAHSACALLLLEHFLAPARNLPHGRRTPLVLQ